MRKPKIYIETSVISHLYAPDRPDWMEDTLKLWEQVKAGKYEACTSYLMILEISRCEA